MEEQFLIDTPDSNRQESPAFHGLPTATSKRWQPLRSGLLNIYRYDEEIFHFEQGRLLLRGHNGTGKSRVLALQLPFLFDADIAPQRVEPDGDPAKRIEWNLLMGRYPDRLGYTWMEFGRRDDQNQEHYLSIGIGLQAFEGRGAPTRWYFILHRGRVGFDLQLRNLHNQPLTRQSLTEAIGDAGVVYQKPDEYRRAVDDALFKLGPDRYRTLMDLLIQLRQPQLSRDLDEKRLSAALSDALPPLDRRIIDDVAESFRGLEKDRLDLQRSEAALKATETFLREYSPYVGCAARRRAAAVRSTHHEYEEAQRLLRMAQDEHAAAAGQIQVATAQLQSLSKELATVRATAETLASSPEMRAAGDIKAAHQRAVECRRIYEQCQADHRAAANRLEQDQRALAHDQRQAAEAEAELRDADESASRAAAHADMTPHHARILEAIGSLRDSDHVPADVAIELAQAQKLAVSAVRDRQRGIDHVAKLTQQVEAAQRQVENARLLQGGLSSKLDKAREDEREAARQVQVKVQELMASYRQWASSATLLSPPAADDLEDALQLWCETGQGVSPVAAAVNAALNAALERLASERTTLMHDLEQGTQQRSELQAQQTALENGRHEPPPCPHTRDVGVRSADQPGAPLWSLLEFRDHVPELDRANLEAAMESAGLLDAWMTPQGRLFDRATMDTCIVAQGSALPESSARLIDFVQADVPALAAARIDAAALHEVLVRIAVGEQAATWVDVDGRWGNGPLRGRWSKPAAQHVGQAARERYRQQQLRELRARLEEVQQQIGQLETAISHVNQQTEAARETARRVPDDQPVRDAQSRRVSAHQQVTSLGQELVEADRKVQQLNQALQIATAKRDQDAADLDIAAWVDRLPDLRDALKDYAHAAETLWRTLRRSLEARARIRTSSERVAASSTHKQLKRGHEENAERELRAAQARHDTLEQTVGQSVREVNARLAAAGKRIEQLEKETAAAESGANAAATAQAVAQTKIDTSEQNLQQRHAARATAIESLTSFARTGLLPVVAPELAGIDGELTSVSRAVELARRMETLLSDISSDDASWDRRQSGVHASIEALNRELLPHELRPQAVQKDTIIVVTTLYNQVECSMPQLRDELAGDAQIRRTVLEENERKVLENTLIDEVANHLHDRLHEAERLVATMNKQVTSRPMSTGMRLKFTWDPVDDGPPGLADARQRLLRAGATWGEEDRNALGQFLHRQIQAVRVADEAATWQEQIEEAFDYRHWHHFGVMRQQDGKWQRLTRRTHGTGSGGEKAVALTLPMFAAAAAHYQSADPLAPRPILLDEVFAGIDSDMRGKCMGLLQAFDLDFIMTSEREWACYAELPGVAIYQLATMPGLDGVLATRWVWNGQQRVSAPPPAVPRPAPAADDHKPGTLL